MEGPEFGYFDGRFLFKDDLHLRVLYHQFSVRNFITEELYLSLSKQAFCSAGTMHVILLLMMLKVFVAGSGKA